MSDKETGMLSNPPKPRKQQKPRQVSDILSDISGDLLALERAVAGYNSLSLAWDSLVSGTNKKALPLFSHKASVDGVKTMECHVDVKNMHPQYVQYVIPAFIHTHGNEMKLAAEDLYRHAQEILKIVSQAVSSQATPPEPDAVQVGTADENEEA